MVCARRACQEGEFVRANDAYILTAIGNAAWPIGITSVGMHARSAHDKMQTGQIGEPNIKPTIACRANNVFCSPPRLFNRALQPSRLFVRCAAHVMNNEMQRKYLQSVKRLMRFEQNRRDDVLPSKKVM
jgi:hypothetical protein